MSETPASLTTPPESYGEWLVDLKDRIHNAKHRTTLAVNRDRQRYFDPPGTDGGPSKFKPEHLGQLGFYMTAVDRQVKGEHDNLTIGLLLCKSNNKIVAEYALSDKTQPMGIAEYKLLESLPAELQTSLPSIEQIEHELAGDGTLMEDESQ